MSFFARVMRKYVWWGVFGIALLWGITSYVSQEKELPYELASVERGDVIQEVSVTGKVSAGENVELSFERGGEVVSVFARVGDIVERGDALVRLDTSELSALRSQAKANLAYEVARLEELKKGARPEEITVSESKLRSAIDAVSDSEGSLIAETREAYEISDNVVRNLTDSMFQNPRTSSPTFVVPTADGKLVSEIVPLRVSMEYLLVSWGKNLEGLQIEKESADAMTNLEAIKSYLEKLALAVNTVPPSTSTPQSSLDAWKSAVSTSRVNISSAISSLISSNQAYRSAKNAKVVAEHELTLKRSAATPEAILAQEAKIVSVQASIDNYDAQIEKTTLRAPFSGIITKQEAKRGENVAANSPIIGLQLQGGHVIEVRVPEVDVAKVSVGNTAKVTLDAYGSEVVFTAVVAKTDPAETVVEGVPTYLVTLDFLAPDERIRSGMTANIDIRTDERSGVLRVPARAITIKDGKRFVRIPDGLETKEIEIIAGLRGSNGMVEVVSGLNEHEQVVTFIKEK